MLAMQVMTEVQRYIFVYYSQLLTIQERAAWKNIITEEKIQHTGETIQAELMRRRWISTDPKVLALLSAGREIFFEKTVERVIAESADQIFFNYCPQCQALAKTPRAKQCPTCFFSWHETKESPMTPEAILTHHLEALAQGDIDAILSDYSEDAIIFAPHGIIRGHDAIRAVFTSFVKNSPPELMSAFKIVKQEIVDEVAYIIWEAKPFIAMATDTFIFRDGKISVQTYAIFSS